MKYEAVPCFRKVLVRALDTGNANRRQTHLRGTNDNVD